MSATAIGFIGLFFLFAFLFLRMPVAMAMLVVGFFGTAAMNGFPAALSSLSSETFEVAVTLPLTVIPLFVLMGNLAGVSGMSADLFNAAYSWVGHKRGGLASATIAGCAGFAALSGSSIASAITMGRVALPEMKRFGYGDALATGAVAAGGTLGILIPPSTGVKTPKYMPPMVANTIPTIVIDRFSVLNFSAIVQASPAGPTSGLMRVTI